MVLQHGEYPRLYIGSDRGVFTTETADVQWRRMSGLPGVAVKSMAINYAAKKLIAGTFGRGLWQVDLVKP
jgi:hypothetical protein